MTRVVAQGTFDILHPGHVHYLRDAKAMGDELHVIVARSVNVTHKEPPIVPDGQRRQMVDALKPVDEAHLGHPEDIFVPIERIEPDVIALGYDQHHDDEKLRAALSDRGIDCEIRRASPLDRDGEARLLSTGQIIEKVIDERCE
ncbi:adenylyltransferase/cytidyltransferase family protein [Haloarcula nitratireducens]|uniref:FAD synthase n=1 Tax=Haloarcula nitratireducens TaxID=2487749 RepID=A0AAW4P9T2_9EURY|nr:adenylyltransferase/cytidyltransferase family protein [Halomicroarcula nitratireducens]MBX0294707.1 FAD synthase [Halomicroarcula nitratireducens]